jgi:peptide/nickel transport system permease protein
MRHSAQLRVGVAFLLAVHAVVLAAGFFAPYDPSEQDRSLSFAPPTALHFKDASGHWRLRPFIYAMRESKTEPGKYEADATVERSLEFFVRGSAYKLFGLFPSSLHFIGVDGGAKLFLIGSDSYGRDQFSRLLYGGQISIFAGLLAAFLSLISGAILGTLAGFYASWIDDGLMRLAELFLAVPWLYMLLAIRAFLPLSISPLYAFLLIVTVIGLVGWARPARLVRGIVLSAKERKYVLAARGFGASDFYLLRTHIVPETYSVLLTQATLLVPQFILAEVTLSFLGLGIAEPVPSWGNMLAVAQQYYVLVSYWWMLLPGLALIVVFLGYFGVADALEKRLQSAAI